MHLLAYIDPGSGSIAIQAVIASALVVPLFLRSQIRKGVSRLRGHSPIVPPVTDHRARFGDAPTRRRAPGSFLTRFRTAA